MTGREKIEAALSTDGAREIPVTVPYEDIYIRDRWNDLTSRPWWHRKDPDIENQVRWREEIWSRLKIDSITLPSFYPREDRENLYIEERDGGAFLIDRRTGNEKPLRPPKIGGWPDSGVASFRPTHPPQTTDEIDKAIPVPAGPRAPTDQQGRDDLAKAIVNGFGRDLYSLGYVSSPLWLCYYLWGFEGLMTMVAVEPELVRYACRRYLRQNIQSVCSAASLGAQAVWIEECMTDMIGSEAFGDINIPLMRELTDEIRSLGLKSIYYFCGNPTGKLEHIFFMGFDALSLEEGKKGFTIDIEEVAEMVDGRFTLLGNLDAIGLLPDGTEEELQAEIERQIRAGRRNRSRFIMSLGSPITPGTPTEQVALYCQLTREVGAADRF